MCIFAYIYCYKYLFYLIIIYNMNFQDIFLPTTTNFTNIRQPDYCYKTWKDLKYVKKILFLVILDH